MRRLGIALIIFISLIMLVGCGQDTAPEVEVPEQEVQDDGEREPVILDADVPDRDPFRERGSSRWDAESSTVSPEGRDPFRERGSSNWEKERGRVSTAGRDPFELGSDEPVEPDDPIDEPDPDEPPDEPDPDDEIVVPDAVTVALTTLDRCWLDVFVDGTRVLRTNVPRGESMEWQGDVILLEQVGREFAVQVTVNGHDMGRLGDLVQRLEDGPVIDREVGVRIELEQRYAGGVLVGLEFASLAD